MLVPLVTAEIVAGVSALALFAQIGLALSLGDDHLGHITFSISFVTVVVRARLASITTTSRRRRSTSARRGSRRLRLVTLPELWPAIIASALLVFALSFDDFVLSFFTTGESPQPLPVQI